MILQKVMVRMGASPAVSLWETAGEDRSLRELQRLVYSYNKIGRYTLADADGTRLCLLHFLFF